MNTGGIPSFGLTATNFESATKTTLNHAPTSLSLDNNSLRENAGPNALIGNLLATDPDANDTFSFSFATGAGDTNNDDFAIVGAQLLAKASFDYELKNTYTVRLRVTDLSGNAFYETPVSIHVTNVHEAPFGQDETVTTPDGLRYTFTINNFAFSDSLDNPEDNFAGIQVTNFPSGGTLLNNNNPLLPGQFVSVADIAAGNLQFEPAPDDCCGPMGFTFRVQDDGIVQGDIGANIDEVDRTMTIQATGLAIWDGGGADNLASTPENWVGDILPAPTDRLLFTCVGSKDAWIDPAFEATVAHMTIAASYDGTVSIQRPFNVTEQLSALGAIVVKQELIVSGLSNLYASLTIKEGASFIMTQGSHNLGETGTISGEGSIKVEGGEFVIAGNYSLEGKNVINGGSELIMSTGTVTGHGTTTVQQGTLTNRGIYHVSGDTDINGGTVQVEAETSFVAGTMKGGEVRGPGRLIVEGNYHWQGGLLGEGLTLEIAASAKLDIEDVNPYDENAVSKAMFYATIENRGSVDFSSFDDIATLESDFDNWTDGLFIANSDATFTGSFHFNNQGTYTTGDGFNSSKIAFASFDNSGLLEIAHGDLEMNPTTFLNTNTIAAPGGTFRILTSGSSTGTFTANGNGTIEFAASSFVLLEQSSLTGSGYFSFTGTGLTTVQSEIAASHLSVAGGSLRIETVANIPNLVLVGNSARLINTTTLTVANSMQWNSGAWLGAGSVTIGANARLAVTSSEGASDHIFGTGFVSKTLTNYGKIDWHQGYIEMTGSFVNAANSQFVTYGGYWLAIQGTMTNSGVIVQKANDSSLQSNPYPDAGSIIRVNGLNGAGGTFENQPTGTIQVEAGLLRLEPNSFVNSTLSGTIQIAEDAQLDLAGSFVVNSAIAVEPVPNSLTVGGLEVTGILSVNQNTILPNLKLTGRLAGSAKVTVSSLLTWNGGTMEGEGTTGIAPDGLLYVTRGGSITSRHYLNNLGRVAYGTELPVNVISSFGSNPPDFAVYNNPDATGDFNSAAQSAWGQYVGAVETKSGNSTSVDPNSLRARETEANDIYVDAEAAAASAYEWLAQFADEDLAAAQANPDISDEELADAEALRDDLVAQAAEQYAESEQAAFEAYQSSLSSFIRDYQEEIRIVKRAFSQALKNAGRAGAVIYNATGDFVPEGNVALLVDYVYNRLRGWSPTFNYNPSQAGPPPQQMSLALELSLNWSAETRAALIAAYPRRKDGLRLDDDIHANLSTFFLGNPTPAETQTKQALVWGRFESTPPAEVDREGLFGRLSRWGSDTGTFLNSLTWDGVVASTTQFASDAWDTSTTFVTNTLQQAIDDPTGFARTVVNGYIEVQANVGTVAANTFTFGLIPSLNSRAQALASQNGFYRVVQIGAVVGRELAITALTGGVGNVIARAGVGVAGALALRMGVTTAAQARFICMATTAQRLAQPYMAYRNLDTITANADKAAAAIRAGDYERAASLLGQTASMMPSTISSFRETGRLAGAMGSMNPQRMRDYLTNCFAAGTPVLGEFGSKPIEEFKSGDRVWARDENDPEGPARLQIIEETFQSVAEIWRVDVGGRAILTTNEHPFWVVDKGWIELKKLRPGDRIAGMSGEETAVRSVEPTGETLPVYNFRVADDHTYFVGAPAWGFSLWAHNACWVSRPGMAQVTRGPVGKRTIVLGTAQVTNGANGAAHAAEINRQVDDIIAREGDRIAYVVLNRAMRTSVGSGFSASRVRPDITIVYKPSAGGRVSVREIGSPGQTSNELVAQQLAALNSLSDSMRGARPDPTLFGQY